MVLPKGSMRKQLKAIVQGNGSQTNKQPDKPDTDRCLIITMGSGSSGRLAVSGQLLMLLFPLMPIRQVYLQIIW